MNSKVFPLVLLATAIIPGCCFKKKPKCEEPSTEQNTYKKGKNSKTFSEEAEEFVLEDDTSVNVFEDNGINNQVSNELSWDNLDEKSNIKLESIQFEFDSSDISPSEKQKIKRNAQVIKEEIKKNPKTRIVIKGHSCKIAKNKEYNYALSQERATKVAQIYEKEGISQDQIKSVGFGSSMLLTDEDGMEAQSPNRRAETVILEA